MNIEQTLTTLIEETKQTGHSRMVLGGVHLELKIDDNDLHFIINGAKIRYNALRLINPVSLSRSLFRCLESHTRSLTPAPDPVTGWELITMWVTPLIKIIRKISNL